MKLVFCLRRLDHLSREEFQRYWRETHGPLVQERAAVLGIDRYVQVHTGFDDATAAAVASRGAPEPYDGVAELWFDDARLAEWSQEKADAARELYEDETRFIDHARSPLFYGEERAFVGDA